MIGKIEKQLYENVIKNLEKGWYHTKRAMVSFSRYCVPYIIVIDHTICYNKNLKKLFKFK